MKFGIFSVVDHCPITNFGGLEHKKVLRSMEFLAKHVFPAFR